jgi:hypothetical protein
MSRSFIQRQAAQALASRQGQASIGRSYATASSTQLEYKIEERRPVAKRGQAKEKKKKDAKLRHAINLYHLTDFFFPTSAKSSSSSSSTATTSSLSRSDTAPERFDDLLNAHIRSSIMGSSNTTSAQNNLDAPLTMKSASTVLSLKETEDEDQFASIYDSKSNSHDIASSLLSPPPSTLKSSSTTASEPAPLPPIDDKEAVQKHIADTVRKSLAARQKNMGVRQSDNLDVRGAQVRDALFGTVGGVQPGLETLRERVEERENNRRAADMHEESVAEEKV